MRAAPDAPDKFGVVGCRCGYKVTPRADVGDTLWVRETWGMVQLKGGSSINGAPADPRYIYRASDDTPDPSEYDYEAWKPSIHMPRAAARIFLRVTGVRCERVQDITEEDAIAEGCTAPPDGEHYHNGMDLEPIYYASDDFAMIWDLLYAKRGYGWHKNPWVWVYEFERAEGGEQG